MRVTLVHNPDAGGGSPGRAELLSLLRGAGYEAGYHTATERDLAGALQDPGEMVVAAGGDGTVAQVAALVAGRGVPLAILPLGVANNLARTLGVLGGPAELVTAWAAWRPRALDAGVVRRPGREQLFFEGAGAGLFTDMMLHVDTERALYGTAELEGGPDAYVPRLRGMLRHGRVYDLGVWLDGEDLSGRYVLLEAMNCRSVGPALELAPDAAPDDGLLDVVLVGEADRPRLEGYLDARLAGDDAPADLPVRKARVLRLEPRAARLHVDDEVWSDSPDLLELSVRPGAVSFLAPA